MKEVKIYKCDEYDKSPTSDDLLEAYDIACKNHCIVRLEWTMKYSGDYHRYIDESTDIYDVIDRVTHMVYGV